jgi:hypothetical protein
MLYPGLQCRVVVLSLLERSEKLHPIRFGTTWHGEPSRKWMKGRNDWANSGSWINAMDGKYTMMEAELDQITTKYAFWSKAKEEAKTSGRRNKCIWVIAQLIKEFEKKNAWLTAIKSTNISMDRGNEVIDPAQVDGHAVTTRYVRWYDPSSKKLIKTGRYEECRMVRYIDQMDADEGDDSFAHQSMPDDDDVIVSTEDIHYEGIDLNKSVKGYNRILMEEIKIGFDDTDTSPSCWVPNEVPNSEDDPEPPQPKPLVIRKTTNPKISISYRDIDASWARVRIMLQNHIVEDSVTRVDTMIRTEILKAKWKGDNMLVMRLAMAKCEE